MLLGSAILGAVASGAFIDMTVAMQALSGVSGTYEPATSGVAETHERPFRAFEQLQACARAIRTG
ncbi:hypothetical protein [Ciceribacter thiooxidans]|uniref:hypothetical protein n=1 Tax=Ciceribacter thiooxidans TaxID=1969821 RepID=UPI001FD00087|nr:hypothetical protein [Ciceribacter thiooxidans]